MAELKQFFEGKKTYIAAGLLVALGVWMVLHGQADNGMSVVLFGCGLVGLGDRANRHQAEILAAIKTGGAIAQDIQAHGKPNAADVAAFLKQHEPEIQQALSDGAKVVAEAASTQGEQAK